MEKLIESISKELVRYKEALINLREHKYNQFYQEKFRRVERNLNRLRISFEKAPRSKKEGLGFIKDKLKKLMRAMTYESKNKILEDLEDSIDKVKEGKEISIFEERIYDEKSPYDFYKDLREIILLAKKEIFIVDLWVDKKMIDIYLDEKEGLPKIKILTNERNIDKKFLQIARIFKGNCSGDFQIKSNDLIHDRIIFSDQNAFVCGQSIKKAGVKPTYLIKIKDEKRLRKIYERFWNSSKKIL